MVKRKRLPSTTTASSEEKIHAQNENGMIPESGSMDSKEVICDSVTGGECQGIMDCTVTTSSGGSGATRATTRLVKPTLATTSASPEQQAGSGASMVVGVVRDGDDTKKPTPFVAGPTLRSSARVQKRHRDSSPSASRQPSKKLGTDAVKNEPALEQGKVRRAWELWSVEDKNAFFEALCECGKDFENIQNYIVQKSRKKGHPPQVLKNKDQVRHFYYRTWHKISKHLNISDDIKKQAQELYGLINYGELRKKIGGRLDEKNGQKLDELVHKGATTIRCKGKNLRIKTPVCRALKKLNDFEDLKDDENLKLPARICMELRPQSNQSWCHVQSLAQNPRVRLNVGLQQRMSSVLNYIQERWRTPASKQRDELQRSFSQLKESPTEEPLLRLMPRDCDNISLISVKTSTEVSSASVSLQSYRRKIRSLGDFADASGPPTCGKKVVRGKGKPGAGDDPKKQVAEVRSPPNSEARAYGGEAKVRARDLDTDRLCTGQPKPELDKCDATKDGSMATKPTSRIEVLEDSNSVPVHELTMRHLMALETAVANPVPKDGVARFCRPVAFLNDSKVDASRTHDGRSDTDGAVNNCDKRNETLVPVSDDHSPELDGSANVESREKLAKLKQGWTLKDCGNLSVGEVYLMLGHPNRLILEYTWDPPTCRPQLQLLPDCQTTNSPVQQLTSVLGRLLQTAALTFTDLTKTKQDRVGPQIPQTCRCCHQGCSTAAASKSVCSKNSNLLKCQANVKGSSKSLKLQPVRFAPSTCDNATSAPTLPDGADGPTSVFHDCFRKPSSAQNLLQHGTNKVLAYSQSEKLVPCDKALREQLDKYAQHRKAKGRMKKTVFVQRELPLLPKTGPTHSMMTLRIVPTASQLAGSFMPVLPNPSSLSNNVGQLPPGINLGQVVTLARASLPSEVTSIATTTSASLLTATPNGSPCTLIFTSVPTMKPATTTSSSVTGSTVDGTLTDSVLTAVAKHLTSTGSDTSSTNSMVLSRHLDYDGSALGSGRPDSGMPNLECSVAASSNTLGQMVSSPDANSKSINISIGDSTPLAGNLSNSPPNISSILEISLPGPEANYGVNLASEVSSDKLLDLTLCNSNSTFGGLISLTSANVMNKVNNDDETVSLTVAPLLGDCHLDRRPSTPGTSPTSSLFKISSLGLESHWCNGETSEFSLSNLLGHLESPVKLSSTIASSIPPNENTTDCLMNENCIDYISKFEDFAAKISTGESSKKTL